MICFDVENSCFNFRSAAVIVQDNHILIHRVVDDDFWALPGGRVEFFETSDKTIEREMTEELGLICSVEKQLWYVENFFELGSKKFHEIANYFLVSLEKQLFIESEVNFKGIETSVGLLFRWVPLSKLVNYNLQPKFLIESLAEIPKSTQYIRINELNV